MNRYPGNHMDSGIVTLPRQLKTRPGAPQTHLAYITGDEAQMLQKHKPGTPHKGPHGVPNYDSFDIDSSGQSSFTSGAQSSAQEASDRGDQSQQPVNFSYSTPDVRSSIQDRQQFRDRTGSQVQTNAEKLTLAAYNMTNNPNFLSQPLLVPGNADYGALMKAYNQALETGNKQIFFQALKGLQDITAGNPDLEKFGKVSGTGWQDWYRRPTTTTTGGGGSTGGSGYGYGYGYGGGHHPGTTGGGVFAAGAAQRYWGPGKARRSTGAPLAEALAYKQRNPVKPENIKMYTQSLVNANRGGIMNLRR